MDGAGGLLDLIDQSPFMIGLERLHINFQSFTLFLQPGIDLSEALMTVNVGLSPAEHVQIGPMNDQDSFLMRFVRHIFDSFPVLHFEINQLVHQFN
jgi:hypothetical protein